MKPRSLLPAILMMALAVACSREGQKASQEVNTQMQTAQKISNLEQDIDAKQNQLNTLLQAYVKSGGQDLGSVMGQGLSPEQTQMLEARLKNEQGVGYRDLISDILTKQKAIDDLHVKVQDIEKTLPAPVDVTRGETHYRIAMNYLTKDRGLDPAKAKALVLKVNIDDELVPGFKVWNFYDNGVYGTFVTQGSAKVSPYAVTRGVKQGLIADRNAAVSQRDALAKEKARLDKQVGDLKIAKAQLTQDVTLLKTERGDLTQKVGQLKDYSNDLDSKLHSVFYKIGVRRSLIREGVVRDPWYGAPVLVKYSKSEFPSRLDLRTGDSVTFTARQVGVDRIRDVSVAPGNVYSANRDYSVSVSPDGQQATVWILNKAKFLSGRSMMILVN